MQFDPNSLNEYPLRKIFPWAVAGLAAFTFALAWPLLYLLRHEDATRRQFVTQLLLAVWLLLANILTALTVCHWALETFGYTLGIAATVIATGFGGAIALGAFEWVAQNRVLLGGRLGRWAEGRLLGKSEND